MRGVIAILLLLPSVCMATTVKIAAEKQTCNNGYVCQQVTGYGTGVIIGALRDGRAAVLTAGHVVRGSSAVRIVWYENQWLAATVLGSRDDQMIDAAILAVRIPGKFNCYELSDDITPNANVVLRGYPESEACATMRGTLNGRVITRVTVRQGMSGGPVFYDGKVVGIIHGHYTDGNRDSVCTPGPALKAWMVETLGYIPSCDCTPPRPAVRPSPIALAPAPPPPPDEVDLSPILSRLDTINARLKRLEEMPLPSAEPGQPGERGAPGPVGPRGEKGDRGPAGIACDSREIVALREEIAALKGSKVRVEIQQNGTTIDSEDYPLTGPIKLDFRGSDDTLKRIQRLEELVSKIVDYQNLSAGK